MSNNMPTVTRDQLLRAEMIVQLGNIAEALRKLQFGGQDTSELENKITELNTKITTLTTNNNQLSQALSAANALVSELQGQLTDVDGPGNDPTPDDVAEVFAHLEITDS